IAVVSHGDISLWQIGSSASVAIETMSESGDNSQILADTDIISGSSGAGIILPGMSETLVFNTSSESVPFLSVATMLVNTNDAFTGKTSIDVSNLAIGDNVTMKAVAYDAGTEANSEVAGTVPGPADGGEGFNATRDDVDYVDYVAQHPGIVGIDDGLSTSVLTTEHKFDNPVIQLSITRL
ncbi:MAG: hypothetical protein GY808_00020, partial [Gammaproteobacteria bacterium]|nr:hypothetical protein [Gammaproteobacteria bacterium]